MRGQYKKWLILGILLAGFGLFTLFTAPKTDAAINPQINFQGKLTNPDGTNVTDGTYSIRFRIYTDPSADATNTCSANSCKWEETQSSVSVTAGIFQVALGSVNNTLSSAVDFSNSGLYLGIKVGSDPEMTPRIQFTAAPYAFNAAQLGGLSSTGYVQLGQGIEADSSTNSSIAINKTGASGNILQLQKNGTDLFTVANNGSATFTGATIFNGAATVNSGTANTLAITSGTNVPTADQLTIDNSGSSGVTTAGVNGLNIHYKGGAAAVEASGMRVDYTPGTTSGGAWSGLRIIENTSAGNGVNSYGLKLEGGGGGAGNSYGIEVASGWDIGIDVQSGGLQLAAQSEPTVPTAGNLRIYAKDIAGRIIPKWIGPAGVDTPFQASLGFNRVVMTNPNGTANCSTGLTLTGIAITGSATCTVPTQATTSLRNSTRRLDYSTTTTAGTSTYQRSNTLQVWRGNAAGYGGFFYTTRFSLAATQTNNRVFVGMTDIAANPTANTDYSTSTASNKIGVVINTSTGNWKFMTNTSGTTPTVNDLGSTIPVNTNDLMELVLFSAPNGTSIGYRVTDISTGAQVSGSASANLPANNVFMAPFFYANNNATGAAVVLENLGWYLESDN